MSVRQVPSRDALPESGVGRVQRSEARVERNYKTVIPTHRPVLLPLELKVFSGFGGGFIISGTGIRCGEGCRDAGD